jgi:hypothetical protein
MIFEYKEIRFIKKFLTKLLREALTDKGDIEVTIVGKVINNIYNDKTYPEVEIVDLQIN